MKDLTELQSMLTRYFKSLGLDKAAILFIMLALQSEAAQGAMVLYLKDHKNPTQEELMKLAVELQELSEELGI